MNGLEVFSRKSPILNGWDQEFERLFESFSRESAFTPACEIRNQEKAYQVELDMPGLKREDIDIEVKENHLYISGERKSEGRDEKNQVVRSERRYGKFARVFSLPQDVKADGIEASFEDGVLYVTLAKEEKAQPKKITIQGSRKDPATVTLS